MCSLVQAHLHTEENNKRSLIGQRETHLQPQHPSDLTLPDEWPQTIVPYSESFLLYDNRPETSSRIIVPDGKLRLRRLAIAITISMFGHFSIAPVYFCQVYGLHVPLRMTCGYFLLQNKLHSVYDEMF